ncbi:GDSL esterase/lipase At5g03820 [Andrographis paniculata]|uniref:GDSL esterase/lipase At5g03820 n=1 Tax=Andrographis paniculata TaxID=175694 RepID=UPI0021E7F48E|nr:GDSL esterase/lipase At5g03820 [Andrographis paniculata]
MEASRSCSTILALILVASMVINGDPLVPALCIFGDSVVDAGNNNNLQTLIKANFPPYGRDFVTHKPTGRFCNGKLAADFTAEYLGFSSYPPPYLSQDAMGTRILAGVNFASAASGYYDRTAEFYRAMTLTQQLSYYKEWQRRVAKSVGAAKANDIFSGGIHLISAGSSDFIQNYYINPLLNNVYTPEQFSNLLLKSYSNFIQNLYNLGARRIGVTNLPPTGCLPTAITMFGSGSNKCVSRLNQDASMFNTKLNTTSEDLKANLPGLKLVVFDIYQPLLDMITKPVDSGFFESRRACCGTGTMETSYLCNARSVGTCSNATEYVFWDGFHPSQSANEKLAQSLLEQGFDLIS